MQGTGQALSNTCRSRAAWRFLRKSIRSSTISAPSNTAWSMSSRASTTVVAITLVVSAHLSPPKCGWGKARNGLTKFRGIIGVPFIRRQVADVDDKIGWILDAGIAWRENRLSVVASAVQKTTRAVFNLSSRKNTPSNEWSLAFRTNEGTKHAVYVVHAYLILGGMDSILSINKISRISMPSFVVYDNKIKYLRTKVPKIDYQSSDHQAIIKQIKVDKGQNIKYK